ncbi:MAG: hypothetical protein M3Q69_06930 [Acidobacteriota bacterium]|nr:hypothetical protein [Acidobacteriota bacterium]
MKIVFDTSAKVRAIHEEMLRRRSPDDSFRAAQELTRFAHQLAFDTVRRNDPDLTDDEIWLRLAEERLGADMVRKVRERRAKAS